MTRSSVVVQGDARRLPLPDNSVHAIVCDPPYGLEFMGREWDTFKTYAGGNPNMKPSRANVADGIAGRDFDAASYGYRQKNPRCRQCGKLKRGNGACKCPSPQWDTRTREGAFVFQAWCEEWATEALRVLRPGGWLLAFGSPRTWHRLTCGIEDAGFELRDQVAEFGPLAWLYGSGFPKSRDVSKDIDRMAGAEREVIGRDPNWRARAHTEAVYDGGLNRPEHLTAPATPEAARWQGWGSALKPSWEPIVVARKPLSGTLASNVLAWGTGALNIDGTRIGTEARPHIENAGGQERAAAFGSGKYGSRLVGETTQGRWPPNVALIHGPGCRPVGVRKVRGTAGGSFQREMTSRGYEGGGLGQRRAIDHDAVDLTKPGYADPNGLETVAAWDCQADCPVRLLDEASGTLHSQDPVTRKHGQKSPVMGATPFSTGREAIAYADRGGASRFMATFPPDGSTSRTFYTAKAPTAERVTVDGDAHATVKPLALMRWLVRMVTPPGGTILDLFCGSGTTGEAAMLEGFRSVLVDLDMASCRKAWIRTDPHIRRRGPIVTDEQGRLVEEGEADVPRLF